MFTMASESDSEHAGDPSGVGRRINTAAAPDQPLTDAVPSGEPAAEGSPADAPLAAIPEALPLDLDQPAAMAAEVEQVLEVAVPLETALAVESAVPQFCAACGAARLPAKSYCDDCGFMFPPNGAPVAASPSATVSSVSPSRVTAMPTPNVRIKGRYEIGVLLSENQGVCRYRGQDHGSGKPVPVIVLWAAPPDTIDPSAEGAPVAGGEDEFLPSFDNVPSVAKAVEQGDWPSLTWEKNLLESAKHPALPAVIESFKENGVEFLVEELPQGKSLWDAWDEPGTDANIRYTWLMQIAEGMHALHKAGGLIEGIRPELVVVNSSGQAVIADLSELLPLPLPEHPHIKATLYTAPELILNPHQADARAGLYSFGAMLYSLEYLGHSLEEKDFEKPYTPKQITERNPDVHPLFFRLINKTFVRDLHTRFPTDEAVKTDPSGFPELLKALDVCRRNFDNVRLDIAAWTTTGMVRTGNEDALALLHGVEARQDDLWEYAMVLLCDGMGGYEAGEVAAALAISEMRKFLLGQPIFSALTGKEPPSGPVNPKAYQDVLLAALRHANKEVYTAARTPGGKGRRGMGCTAECVYVDNRNVIVGHVGDSRTYHLSQGRLVQLTRDQTLVNRLVELGQLTEAEAENHPRKNELQQALGGQPDVSPGVYSAKLKRGDWVLVCSDGLTNHIPAADLKEMMTREAAYSAEETAHRLMNLVNLRGATDNATIVVIRAS
jgi:PPM family protein phosphatase